jgi:hypothetical protein
MTAQYLECQMFWISIPGIKNSRKRPARIRYAKSVAGGTQGSQRIFKQRQESEGFVFLRSLRSLWLFIRLFPGFDFVRNKCDGRTEENSRKADFAKALRQPGTQRRQDKYLNRR